MDLYKTLGADRSAPTEVIEAAYGALAKKHHPDKNRVIRTRQDDSERFGRRTRHSEI